MLHRQISIARKASYPTLGGEPLVTWKFFFRTDWMETDDADVALKEIKERFVSPEFKIHVNERNSVIKHIDIT